jgi:hypothetical protein
VISLGSIITSGQNLEKSILPIAACFLPSPKDLLMTITTPCYVLLLPIRSSLISPSSRSRSY